MFFKRKKEYTLSLSEEAEKEIKSVCYFFDIDMGLLVRTAIAFFVIYKDFIKKNPNGKVFLEAETTKQEVKIF